MTRSVPVFNTLPSLIDIIKFKEPASRLLARSEIKGSCQQLMNECFLLPLFQNESSCETFHMKMS